MEATQHIPVLREEVIEWLRASAGGLFLDCTLGGAGHTAALLEANVTNRVIAIDRDERALERCAGRLAPFAGRVEMRHLPFGDVAELEDAGPFDGILADLGLSTDQLKGGRGFSFRDDESLDMRIDQSKGDTAHDVVSSYGEGELRKVFQRGGVGANSNRYARAIVQGRPFASSKALASAVAEATPIRDRHPGFHPATVVFQALRIEVNREFEQLDALLDAAPTLVKAGGRLAVITFHSLEDRITTKRMREWQSGGEYSARVPGSQAKPRLGKLLTRDAVKPGEAEIERNPAARSAAMRVFEFGEAGRPESGK